MRLGKMLNVILIYSCLHLWTLSARNASCLQVSHNANRVDTQTGDHAMLLRTTKALLTLVCPVCAAVPCSCSCWYPNCQDSTSVRKLLKTIYTSDPREDT